MSKELKWYCAAVAAQRRVFLRNGGIKVEVPVAPYLIPAGTRDEAVKIAIRNAKDKYPSDDGYLNHDVALFEVDLNFLIESYNI
jgi:hypothetical protein